MEYSYDYFFDEDNLCFYIDSNKETTFKNLYDLHKNDEATFIQKDIYNIKFGNYFYQLKSPGDVTFIFPDGQAKKVFISSYKHIKKILRKYIEYDFYYCKDDEEKYDIFNLDEIKNVYPVKKIKISKKEFKEIYKFKNQVINDYSKLSPGNLTLSYEKYLKNSIYIEENSNFFNYTEERRNFFKLLDYKLLEKNLFLPICGPEGVGKTSSILAYCRIKLRQDYFYYNTKIFAEFLKNNNPEEIRHLLIKELSNCLTSNELNDSIEKIMKFNSYNCGPIEFLINILEKIDIPDVLIIDQYKSSFDEDYYHLQKLLDKYQSFLKIILLSSMNEDDVKLSIIKGINKEKITKSNFFLDYLYIGKLTIVSDDDLNSLNKSEKEVLGFFGNLYPIFYEIIDFKKKNNNNFSKSDFLDKKSKGIKNNLLTYFKTEDKIKIYNALSELFSLELSTLTKETFLTVYEYIPFRYIQLSINEKFSFRMSEIKDNDKYRFQYLYNYFVNIINILIGEFYQIIQKDSTLIENAKKGMKPYTFENNVFGYIWGFKKFNGDILKYKIRVSSIYNISDNDCSKIKDLRNINEGEGFIIEQESPIATFFDIGILVKMNENIWKLYLIQITKKKNAEERLTLTFLNDFFGYIKAILKVKCQINVEKSYFCYIFDDESKDTYSVDYCKKRNIDYLFYNETNRKMSIDEICLEEYKMKKKIFESEKEFINYEKDFEIKKYYPINMDFEVTKNFLRKKRHLMNNTNFIKEQDLIERINKKKSYYQSIKENFHKEMEIDYNDREEEINNFLVDTEFKDKDLVGIKLLIPNQKACINKLNNLGLKEIEINNFFEIIGKDKNNFLLLNIEELKFFIPSKCIPEYLNYIIIKTEDKILYQDYENKKSFDLSNKNEGSFTKYNEDWKYIAITLINKNLSKEMNSLVFGLIKRKY